MKINYYGLLSGLSYALDCVEEEILGVKTNHSKRVAYICMVMGEELGLDENELMDLSACALLHDNALTEYIYEEYLGSKKSDEETTGIHCILGERNIKKFPFNTNVNGAVLYHHEEVNGTGPFKKRSEDTHLFAQLICFADQIDIAFALNKVNEEKYKSLLSYLDNEGKEKFLEEHIELFKNRFNLDEFMKLGSANIDEYIYSYIKNPVKEYTNEDVRGIVDIFARIIDYKSQTTRKHSLGIAEKIDLMSKYYGYDEETATELHIAASLHDIGKLAVRNSVLEKSGKLTDGEFEHMKEHAMHTFMILNNIDGFEKITKLASHHHEKNDGSGYPFGLKGEQLSFEEKLVGCIDIYQALVEDRTYKKGFTHDKALEILNDMAEKGLIEKQIVSDIDKVFCN